MRLDGLAVRIPRRRSQVGRLICSGAMPSPARETSPVERATLRAFVASSTVEQDRLLLDEPTWDDLDMDTVVERLDRTASLPGRMAFYRMLRTPSASASVLAERERLIGLFEKDQGLAAALREELVRLNRTVRVDELVQLLWGEPPEALPFPWVYPLLTVAAVVTLAAAVAIGELWLLVMVAVLVVNATIHFNTRVRWQDEIEALRFVAALLAAARRVARLEAEGLGDGRRRLAGAVRQTQEPLPGRGRAPAHPGAPCRLGADALSDRRAAQRDERRRTAGGLGSDPRVPQPGGSAGCGRDARPGAG